VYDLVGVDELVGGNMLWGLVGSVSVRLAINALLVKRKGVLLGLMRWKHAPQG